MHILLKNLLIESVVENNPNFRKWFKSSKVTDASQHPLVVYHGTTSNKMFDIFNTALRGAWFATNPDEASAYTIGYSKHNATRPKPDYVKKHARVLPVYLSIQNPKIYTSKQLDMFIDTWSDEKNYKMHFKQLVNSAKNEKYDGLIFRSDTPSRNIYVAFYSTQIKSIFNNGEFDSSNSDISK